MIPCRFIGIDGEEPDLVISFSCAREIYDQENDIILQGTRKYEHMLPEHERGALVSVGYGSDEINMLESIGLYGRNVIIKDGCVIEEPDCRNVSSEEWAFLKEFLKRVNCDNSFEVKIA